MHVELTSLHFKDERTTFVTEIVAGNVRVPDSTFHSWTYAKKDEARKMAEKKATSCCNELGLPLVRRHEYAPGVKGTEGTDVQHPQARAKAGA